jgi:hypothetical protein
MKRKLLTTLSGIVALGALAGCLHDDDKSISSINNTTTTTTISGSAVKGPVSGATVTVRNAATGSVIGTTTTNSTGGYSLRVPYSGDAVVEIAGGNYTDETTGANTPLQTPMRVVVNANGGNVTGMVTPLTTMAFSQAFGAATSGNSVTSAAFQTMAGHVASQFRLTGANLATDAPAVTGTTNAYGQALRAPSRYMQTTGTTQAALMGAPWTSAQWTAFSTPYTAAYNAANGTNITHSFNGSTLTIGGTGAGGGTGICGVAVGGIISAGGFNVPINMNYCYTGLANGACGAGNNTLNQSLASQSDLDGAANLTYTYSSTCAAGAINIALQ